MAEDRLEGLAGGFVPTTPCPLLIRPVRPLPNGRIPPLHEDQNQYPLLKDTPEIRFIRMLGPIPYFIKRVPPQYCSWVSKYLLSDLTREHGISGKGGLTNRPFPIKTQWMQYTWHHVWGASDGLLGRIFHCYIRMGTWPTFRRLLLRVQGKYRAAFTPI